MPLFLFPYCELAVPRVERRFYQNPRKHVNTIFRIFSLQFRSAAAPQPNPLTEGNEAKEGFYSNGSQVQTSLFSPSSVKNFFENRSTEENEDTEDFQNQRLRPLFPSLPPVKILSDASTL